MVGRLEDRVTKKNSRKQQAAQTADSVKTLATGLTPIIADVRSSHGNVGSTFKLYNSLTLVCENMDALVEATHAYGKKEEYNKLAGNTPICCAFAVLSPTMLSRERP